MSTEHIKTIVWYYASGGILTALAWVFYYFGIPLPAMFVFLAMAAILFFVFIVMGWPGKTRYIAMDEFEALIYHHPFREGLSRSMQQAYRAGDLIELHQTNVKTRIRLIRADNSVHDVFNGAL